MTEAYKSMSNSMIMWIACLPGILIVLFQAMKFFLKTKRSAGELGLSEKQMKSAIRSAAITSIGPCFVMLTTMLTLMLYVGSPLAWLRVDFIGSAIYELQAADLTSKALGWSLAARPWIPASCHLGPGHEPGLRALGIVCGALRGQNG